MSRAHLPSLTDQPVPCVRLSTGLTAGKPSARRQRITDVATVHLGLAGRGESRRLTQRVCCRKEPDPREHNV